MNPFFHFSFFFSSFFSIFFVFFSFFHCFHFFIFLHFFIFSFFRFPFFHFSFILSFFSIFHFHFSFFQFFIFFHFSFIFYHFLVRDHRDVHSALPSIYIPPWAGGGSQPVSCTRIAHVCPTSANDSKAECAFGAPNDGELESRHCHQLFCRLRLLERGAMRDRVRKNLGHSGDLLDVRQQVVEDLPHCPPLSLPAALRIVEKRKDGCRVSDLPPRFAAGLAPAA